MPRYFIKAYYTATEWGRCYATVEADSEEEALRMASEHEVDWDHWKVDDHETRDMGDFEIVRKETDA